MNAINRFQSNVSVRAAEAAFLVMGLGGFYVLALLRIIAPYSRGPTYQLLNATPIVVLTALTVFGPFTIVMLEWLSAYAELRRQPDAGSWRRERQVQFLLRRTSVTKTTAAFVYLPLLPAAAFWTVVAIVNQEPYWPLTALVALADLGIIIGVNEYVW